MTMTDLENIIVSYDLDFKGIFLDSSLMTEYAKYCLNKIKIQDLVILCEKDDFSREQCDRYFSQHQLPDSSLEMFYETYFLKNWRIFRSSIDDFESLISSNKVSLEHLVKVLPFSTVLEIKNIIGSTNGLKNLEEWSKTNEYQDALLIDSVCPDFVDAITQHLTFKVDESLFFKKVNRFNNRNELINIMNEIVEMYGKNRYFLNSKFLKQYHEEIIPINKLLVSNKISDNWDRVQFSIQDNSKSKEDSFDALLIDEKNNIKTRIECVSVLDDWEHLRALNIIMGKYGKTCSSKISTVKGAYEWIKNNSQPPMSAYTFNIKKVRADMVEKIINAFNKKNSKINYKEWDGNIMLLITQLKYQLMYWNLRIILI